MNKQKRKGYPLTRRVMRFGVLACKKTWKYAIFWTSVIVSYRVWYGIVDVEQNTLGQKIFGAAVMTLISYMYVAFAVIIVAALATGIGKWIVETWRQAGREG